MVLCRARIKQIAWCLPELEFQALKVSQTLRDPAKSAQGQRGISDPLHFWPEHSPQILQP